MRLPLPSRIVAVEQWCYMVAVRGIRNPRSCGIMWLMRSCTHEEVPQMYWCFFFYNIYSAISSYRKSVSSRTHFILRKRARSQSVTHSPATNTSSHRFWHCLSTNSFIRPVMFSSIPFFTRVNATFSTYSPIFHRVFPCVDQPFTCVAWLMCFERALSAYIIIIIGNVWRTQKGRKKKRRYRNKKNENKLLLWHMSYIMVFKV